MNTLGKILIVDDEQDIIDLIEYNLFKAGYETATANDGAAAIKLAKQMIPDLILLDVMMPEKDGLQTLKELRTYKELDHTVIIFLTALSDEQSEIGGLKAGADDYIAKPIKQELLLTRIRTALRRAKVTPQEDDAEIDAISFGDLVINRTNYTVYIKDQPVVLAKKEFELLNLLASKPNRVFLRNEILQKVWGADVIVGDRTIDVHVRKIRQKMNLDVITTVKGVGYKFELI